LVQAEGTGDEDREQNEKVTHRARRAHNHGR
jgi:hypothetical protein